MGRHRGQHAAMLLAVSAVAACAAGSPPSSVAARSYDRRCESVADCVSVYEGHVGCCASVCPNTAIAQVALASYTADFDRAASCGGIQPPCPELDLERPAASCPDGRVQCDDGGCKFEMPPGDAATDE